MDNLKCKINKIYLFEFRINAFQSFVFIKHFKMSNNM